MAEILFCRLGILGEEDVLDVLKRVGHTVAVFQSVFESVHIAGQSPECYVLKSVDYDTDYVKKIVEYLNAGVYDYIFSMGFIPIISKVCDIYKIPYVSWAVDAAMTTVYSKAFRNPWNRVFLFDYHCYEKYKTWNPGNVFYMPLGVNIERLDAIVVPQEEEKVLQCDVSFVGSLYSAKSKLDVYDKEGILPEYLRGFLKGVMESQLLIHGYSFIEEVIDDEKLEKVMEYVGWIPPGEDYEECSKELIIHNLLEVKATTMERIRLLQALSKQYQVDLYTNDDPKLVPMSNHRGTVRYLETMPKVFKCSKINLNITARNIPSGIPLRVWDIIGAGGFVITNYQPEIAEYFTIGKEIVVYESQEDLVNKVGYYLAHEEERLAIAKAGYEKVKERFTWEARLRDIFRILGEQEE